MNDKIATLRQEKIAAFEASQAAFFAWWENPCEETNAAYKAARKAADAADSAEWAARREAGEKSPNEKLVEAIFGPELAQKILG